MLAKRTNGMKRNQLLIDYGRNNTKLRESKSAREGGIEIVLNYVVVDNRLLAVAGDVDKEHKGGQAGTDPLSKSRRMISRAPRCFTLCRAKVLIYFCQSRSSWRECLFPTVGIYPFFGPSMPCAYVLESDHKARQFPNFDAATSVRI